MAEALAKKKRIRAGHKASATKTISRIEDILATETPDKERLSLLRLTLNEKLETIKALDSEVIELIDDETMLADEIEQADGYKESVFNALIKIDRITKAPAARATSSPTEAPPTERRTPPPDSRSSRVRLPKLQLHSFSGDLTKWTSFWESFESAVHNNNDLTDVEKFNYLTSLLERSAREAVSGLALTATNYHEAIDTLKKRFGCKQQIVNKHMDALLHVEAVSSSQNTRALRRLFDNISCHIRSLKSLGVDSDSYGSLLCPVFLNKIPADLQLIVSRKVSEDEWNLDLLMTAIEEEITARERVSAGQSRPSIRRSEYKSPPTATTLVSGETSSTQMPCCYCNQPHPPSDCNTVTQVEARKQLLRRNGRCFSCLRRGHLSRDCRSTNRCCRCKGHHHTSICSSSVQPRGSTDRHSSQPPPLRHGTSTQTLTTTVPSQSVPTATSSTLNPSASAFISPPTSTSLYANSNKTVLLQTALAKISNPRNSTLVLNAKIVLDSGSQKSYLTQRVKDGLSLPVISKQRLAIAAFGSSRGEPKQCEVVRLVVHTKSGSTQELDLFVVPYICDPLTTQTVSTCSRMYSHLSQLDLADISQEETLEVDVLIGSDFYWEFVTGETIRGHGGPVALETTLGWVLSGPAGMTGQHSAVSLITTHTLRVEGVTNKELDATLRSFWELESLGIQSPNNDPVFDQFSSTVQMKGGRYEVSLPWREYHDPLPNNYNLSRKRLYGLRQRLKQRPAILREYNAIICDQLKGGIVEVVQEPDDTPRMVHYLPHHAVIREDKKTTKVRIVYDASARSSGPSLNDCLHTGPKFNQKIVEILLRFRSYPIALVADIEKAFLMISVAPKDRDVLRFLWLKDAFQENSEIVKLRFTRVVFGVSPSPFLLNATIRHHIEKYQISHPELVKVLMQSIYVDDVVFGADTEEDARALYASSKELLRYGSFNLRKFVTNSPSLQKLIDANEATSSSERSAKTNNDCVEVVESDETYVESILPISYSCPDEQKVLGVHWNVSCDQLVFNLDGIAETATHLDPTKRNVISLIGKFYDPLGFLSPVTIRFKTLMQELCKTNLGWDQPLEGELLNKWNRLVDDLKANCPIVLPRSYFYGSRDEPTNYRLYGFCDASITAFAAVVYLVEEADGHKTVSFVASKTRVAPLKTLTIPRLELLSAVLLARLISCTAHSLSTRIDLQEPKCFTDSQVTLFWIKGTGRDWKPFVQNRVNEVRKLVPVECWDHCSGKENPADIPSRGLTPVDLSVNYLWKNGSEWLKTSINVAQLPEEIPELCVTELKATSQGAVHNLLTTQPPSIGQIIDIQRFSSIHKLYRVTAYVLKFIKLLRKQVKSHEITQTELSEAERLWIMDAQYGLVQNQNFPKWKAQFGLFQDESQVWRCGGRLHHANLPFSSKHPVILSKTSTLAMLIAHSAHQRVQHNGVKETLTEIRAKYWIIGGRSLIRSIIHKCVTCRRFEGRPFIPPPAPPLPSFRVKEAPPFAYTAVDFAGPMYLKCKGESSSSKSWICLFTCCVTRAIHLELVPDMTTTTFIRCLKRFAARRGLPRRIISDNAKTFKAAAKLIKTIFTQKEVQDYLTNFGVEWTFNLEKAPWWGGLFERMVKSTKRCLKDDWPSKILSRRDAHGHC